MRFYLITLFGVKVWLYYQHQGPIWFTDRCSTNQHQNYHGLSFPNDWIGGGEMRLLLAQTKLKIDWISAMISFIRGGGNFFSTRVLIYGTYCEKKRIWPLHFCSRTITPPYGPLKKKEQKMNWFNWNSFSLYFSFFTMISSTDTIQDCV